MCDTCIPSVNAPICTLPVFVSFVLDPYLSFKMTTAILTALLACPPSGPCPVLGHLCPDHLASFLSPCRLVFSSRSKTCTIFHFSERLTTPFGKAKIQFMSLCLGHSAVDIGAGLVRTWQLLGKHLERWQGLEGPVSRKKGQGQQGSK